LPEILSFLRNCARKAQSLRVRRAADKNQFYGNVHRNGAGRGLFKGATG
jgi:hypothetical protein